MRIPGLLLVLLFSASVFSQAAATQNPQQPETMASISTNVARLTAAVDNMNRNWFTFFQTFSSDKGGQYFTDRQKRLLFALEVLNRYEKSMMLAQELRLSLVERQSKMRLQLATITDDLRPESVDRSVVWRGTTNAEAIRDIRRQALQKEQRDLSSTLAQIASELTQTNSEIQRAEQQIRLIRAKIFGEIDREMDIP